MNARITQITNRHIAKLLTQLDEVNTPEIIKTTVKSHFWWYAQDLEEARLQEKEHDNETN